MATYMYEWHMYEWQHIYNISYTVLLHPCLRILLAMYSEALYNSRLAFTQ
jgi:hypothetical protein